MKVKCIECFKGITKGSIYEVVNHDYKHYKILNDDGVKARYNKDKFSVVEFYTSNECKNMFNDSIELNAIIESEELVAPDRLGITNDIWIDFNYSRIDKILENADRNIVYIRYEDDEKFCTTSFGMNEMIKLRDYLNESIEFVKSIGYKKRVDLTQEEIENLLGYKINII